MSNSLACTCNDSNPKPQNPYINQLPNNNEFSIKCKNKGDMQTHGKEKLYSLLPVNHLVERGHEDLTIMAKEWAINPASCLLQAPILMASIQSQYNGQGLGRGLSTHSPLTSTSSGGGLITFGRKHCQVHNLVTLHRFK